MVLAAIAVDEDRRWRGMSRVTDGVDELAARARPRWKINVPP